MNSITHENSSELYSQDVLDAQIKTEHQLVRQTRKKHQFRLAVTIVFGFILLLGLEHLSADFKLLLSCLLAVITVWGGIELIKQLRAKNILSEFEHTSAQVAKCLSESELNETKELATKLSVLSKKEQGSLLFLYSKSKLPEIAQHVRKLEAQKYKQDLELTYKNARLNLVLNYSLRPYSHPLKKVKTKLNSVFIKLTNRRKELQAQWDTTYETLSWWNKIKHAGGPDFSQLDGHILKVKDLKRKFHIKHGADLVKLDAAYKAQHEQALNRCQSAFDASVVYVDDKYASSNSTPNISTDNLLYTAGWAGMFGLSYSIWDDFTTTGQVYDALRNVNGNFEGMSDSEIWAETLLMSSESLAGLANLTKGAYFEQLVADDTQGTLFEHFNHPDTDITIDGIAYQLKATDSASYVNSVDDGIPVIATTEVAETTNAIDSGFTHAELTTDVDMAINGIGVDVGDAMADGILAGLGGLGFFATLNGINHAAERYNQGSDGEQAIFEGLGVAITGTAKAMVDASEMVYKAATSRPSRAVGRGVLSVLKKLDQKFEDAANKN